MVFQARGITYGMVPKMPSQGALLPVVDIHGIAAGVMERVLDFVYTDSFLRGLGGEWLTPAGAERLFGAADMLLLFSMKVTLPTTRRSAA